MKKSVTLILFLFVAMLSRAQWSDTKNQFYDSLHMPVSIAAKDQQHPVVIKSYPDSGYIIVWEDARNTGNGFDIYAQKYDKAGNILWAKDGVPVVAGIDNQVLATSSSADYRYYSHACTDSAGGFYVAWDDDNQTGSGSTARHRVCAQHVMANGSAVFAYPGFIVAQPTGGALYQFSSPQLIADGNKGFFVAYIKIGDYGDRDVYANCYRDENGSMKLYGGGQANINEENVVSNTACGVNSKNDAVYKDAAVSDFQAYSDLQNGCSLIMTMSVNEGGNDRVFLGYNRLCRVKKESHVTVSRRADDIAVPVTNSYVYTKDSVVMLYNLKTYSSKESCKDINGNLYEYTNYYVENFGNGFLTISNLMYGAEFAKGTVAPTDGNINVNIIASSERDLVGNTTPTDWYKRVYYRNDEVYDSIPYQLTTDTTHPYFAYNLYPNTPLDKINYTDDTLLGPGVYDYDFALASSNSRVFAAGMIKNDTGGLYPRHVALQQYQIDRMSSDSFAVHLHTASKFGAEIGREIATGFGGNNISYDNPLITTDQRGNALFTITDQGRSARVSPIADSGRLVWGAMGRPIGTGLFNGNYYNPYAPYVALSPSDGTGIIAWTDSRYIPPTSTGLDIYARHLDSLNFYNYLPPQKTLHTLSYEGSQANPLVLTGTSFNWSFFDALNNGYTSTFAAILDNYNLGNVTAKGIDNGGAIRRYNNKPYLDRNYTVSVENKPVGATIDIRLYFTTAQFTALQAADPTITSPGDLIVIKQPNASGSLPTEYTPVTGEEMIVPSLWQVVDGGYYIQLPVTSFSNFFIEKNDGILPVTWLNVNAQRTSANTATVNWAVANETNVKNYLVQYSEDGITYKDGCTTSANGLGEYNCTLTISNDKKYYFKVKETDFDGRSSNSQTVWLDKLQQLAKFVISPNPVRQEATLSYSLPASMQGSLKLMNGADVIVWQQNTMLSTSGTIKVPLNHFPSGVYNLQIITCKTTQLLKIVKE